MGVVCMNHDLLSLKSEVLDLTGLSIADLRSHDDELLVSSGSGLLRQVYRPTGNFGPADPPSVSAD
jgi:hypothetical protein